MGLSNRNLHDTDASTTRAATVAPPLSRDLIDDLLPWLRILFGASFVAYCALSTLFGVHTDAVEILAAYATTIQHWVGLSLDPVGYILGVVVALVVFVGEVSTAERYPKLYLAFLAIDVYYSFSWSHVITRFVISDRIWAASVVEWLAAFVMATLVAYYGEVILFGRRRSGV